MIAARIAELTDLADRPFKTVLDVDVDRRRPDGSVASTERRSFIPLEQAGDLRDGLREAMRSLKHYRNALKARIVADSAFAAGDLGRIDQESPESADSGPESPESGPQEPRNAP